MTTSSFSLAVLLVVGGCSANTEPALEEWVEGEFRPRTVSAYKIDGHRDGATTQAVATFTLESGTRVHLEIEVSYNPAPVMNSGRWRLTGADADSGLVVAESLKFLGGQGEGPSFGGRFRLETDAQPRFRAQLPLRVLRKTKWQVE